LRLGYGSLFVDLRQVLVITHNPRKIDEIVFIPPDSKEVKKLIGDLLKFIESNIGKIEPIILTGFFQRQCVIIHPFIADNRNF
jgi:Fic family protein